MRALSVLLGWGCALTAVGGCAAVEEAAEKEQAEESKGADTGAGHVPEEDTAEGKEDTATEAIPVETGRDSDEAEVETEVSTDEVAVETEVNSETGGIGVDSDAVLVGTDADLEVADTEEADAGDLDLDLTGEMTSLLVIYDRSGSMGDRWGSDTKWVAASNALVEAVGMVQHRLSVGAILFPMTENCEVEDITGEHQIYFMPAGDFLAEWEAATKENGPSGSTPLARAFEVADKALLEAREAGALEKTVKILVLTDGMPNCESEPNALTAYPAKWLEQGITTYVFGLPGSASAAQVLDDIAAAGGSDTHFSTGEGETSDDLRDDILVCV